MENTQKQEIIAKLLEHGIMVTPEILEKINSGNIDSVFSLAKKHKKLVVESTEPPEKEFGVHKVVKKKKVTPKDFIEYYNKKFDLIRDILLRKINAVSINKAKTLGSDIGVIGMVCDQTQSGYMIEDQTGKIEARTKEDLMPDAVLGFKGFIRENILFVQDVAYPDIPLDNEIRTADLKIILSKEKIIDKADFIISPKKFKIDNLIHARINPEKIKLVKKGSEVNVIVYEPKFEINQNKALQFLKMRFIPEDKIPNENYIIDKVPDILWIIQEPKWTENYKGVSIVSGNFARIDLGTREVGV